MFIGDSYGSEEWKGWEDGLSKTLRYAALVEKEAFYGVEVAFARGRGDGGVSVDAEGVPRCALLAI